MLNYAGVGRSVSPEAVAGRKIQPTYVTCQAPVASVWTDICTAANAISSNNGQLETGHWYAIAWVNAYSAEAVAIRFNHSDFQGCAPGGMFGRTLSHRKNFLDFAHHGSLPVFSASSPLIPEVFAIGTGVPVCVVGLIDLGTSPAGNIGVEDFNLAYATLTNTAALAILAVAAGDTMYAQDGRGEITLRGVFLTGTAPLRGQLRSTDLALTPNYVEIPPHCTLAGDYINEIILPSPVLKPNSLINCYASC